MRLRLKKIGWLWLLGLLWGPMAHAQLLQYSNEAYTPQRTNPAWGAGKPTHRMGVQYRYNASAANLGFHTARASGNYIILAKRNAPFISLSGAVLQDQERPLGVFEKQEVTGAFSMGIPIAKGVILSAGLQGHWQQESVSLSPLTTGSQYLPERGYDPGLGNGETFGDMQHQYWSYSTGLLLTSYDRHLLTPIHMVGLAFYDLNRPPLSFLNGSDRRSPTMVAQAAYTIYRQGDFLVRPDVMWQSNGELTSTTIGMGWGYQFNERGKRGEGWLHTRYRWNEVAMVGITVRQEAITLGYTYDFAIARSNNGLHHAGAHEIAFSYDLAQATDWWWRTVGRTPRDREGIVWPKLNIEWPKINWPKWLRRKKPRSRRPRRTPPTEEQPEPEEEGVGAPADSTTGPQGAVEIGEITPYDLEPDTVILEDIVKHFYFETNQAELDTSALQYLDSLLVSLKENEEWLIDIIGHTDNVGEPELNMQLSRERALSVGWYLAKEGVSRRRIRVRGRGETEPLESNDTEEGRSNNRRVQITIYRVPPKE